MSATFPSGIQKIQRSMKRCHMLRRRGVSHCPTTSITNDSINITCSFLTALEFLRYGARLRQFWVNANCTYQQDTKERGTHVALMADVLYFGAFVQVVSNAFQKMDNGAIAKQIFSFKTLVSRFLWLNVTIPHDSIFSPLSLVKEFAQAMRLSPSSGLRNPKASLERFAGYNLATFLLECLDHFMHRSFHMFAS